MDRKESNHLSPEDYSKRIREKVGFVLKTLIDNVLNQHNVNASRSNATSNTSEHCTCDPLITKNDVLGKLMDLTCGRCGITDLEFYENQRPCKICESQSKSQTLSTKGKENSKENEKYVQFPSPNFPQGEPTLENPQVFEKKSFKSDPRPIKDSESMNEEQLQNVTLLQSESSQNSQLTKKYETPGTSAEIPYPSIPKCRSKRERNIQDKFIKKCCEASAVKLSWFQHPKVKQVINEEIKPEIFHLISATSDKLKNIAKLQEGHVLSEKSIDPKLLTGSLLIEEDILKQKTIDLLITTVCELREELANESINTNRAKTENNISEIDSSKNELKAKISNLVTKTANKLNPHKEELNASSGNNVQVQQDSESTQANHFSPIIAHTAQEHTTEQENFNFTPQSFNISNDNEEAQHTSELLLNDLIHQVVLADTSVQRRPTEENIKKNVWDIVKSAVNQLPSVREYQESISKFRSPLPLSNILTVQDKVYYVLEVIIKITNKMMKEGLFPASPFASLPLEKTDSQSDPNLREVNDEIRKHVVLLAFLISENIMQEVPIEDTTINGVTVPPLSPLIRDELQTEVWQQIFKSIIAAAEKLKNECTFSIDDAPLINPDSESPKMIDSTEEDGCKECKQTTIMLSPVISKADQTKHNILNIINEILNDSIKQAKPSDQKSEFESPFVELTHEPDHEFPMDLEFISDIPSNTCPKFEIPCAADVCYSDGDELLKLNICDSEEEVTKISDYAMDNTQLNDTKKLSDHLCKNSKPCASYRIAKVLASNQENIEALNQKQDPTDDLERSKEPNNSNTSQVNREKIYKDKLKQYIYDLVRISMQEHSQQKDKQTNNKSTDDKSCIKPCPGEHSDPDIQALIIIIEAFLDKFITISCECEFPLEKLCNLLGTISKAVENTSSEEFQKYMIGITQEDSSRKEANDASPKSWILGQTFDIEPKETKPTDDTPEICDNIHELKTDTSLEGKKDINVIDAIPVRRTKDSIIQTESNHDLDESRKKLPCSPLMRGMTQLQFKHLVDVWFKEFKDFTQLFTRQSNFVVKNDFVLTTSREKLESLNNIVAKCTTSLEFIEKSLRETDELQCECLTIHSMYLNADIKGKGERERMYTNLLQVQQSLDETSKLKDIINEQIKHKIDGSLITKVTRILNCFANTLQGVEYKMQVLEHELQAVKNLSAAVISKKLWS